MSTTDEQVATVSDAWSPLTTVVVAARSAIGAISLVAVFDRQFIVSKWLHWALQNWKDFFGFVFSVLHINVPEENRAIFAFCAVMLSLVTFDVFLRGAQWLHRRSLIYQMPDRQTYKRELGRHERQLYLWVAAFYAGLFAFLVLSGSIFDVLGAKGPSSFPSPWMRILIPVVVLGVSVAASPRMSLWLAAFTAAFIGLNEVALLFEQSMPQPPG